VLDGDPSQPRSRPVGKYRAGIAESHPEPATTSGMTVSRGGLPAHRPWRRSARPSAHHVRRAL